MKLAPVAMVSYMIDTPVLAAAEIKRLDLPSVFGAVMDGTLTENQKVPNYLCREFRRPQTYFGLCHDLVQHVPALAELCPLWEQNGEAIIGRLPDGSFVRFHYEDAALKDPGAAIEVLGNNYQQFLTSILLEVADSGLFDQYAQEVAEILCYKHFPTLRDILSDWSEADSELRLTQFRNSLT